MKRETDKSIITLRRFRDLPEALVAKSILDSAGIESFLCDENLVRMDWFYSPVIGGMRLWVREEDASTAEELPSLKVPAEFDVDSSEPGPNPSK